MTPCPRLRPASEGWNISCLRPHPDLTLPVPLHTSAANVGACPTGEEADGPSAVPLPGRPPLASRMGLHRPVRCWTGGGARRAGRGTPASHAEPHSGTLPVPQCARRPGTGHLRTGLLTPLPPDSSRTAARPQRRTPASAWVPGVFYGQNRAAWPHAALPKALHQAGGDRLGPPLPASSRDTPGCGLASKHFSSCSPSLHWSGQRHRLTPRHLSCPGGCTPLPRRSWCRTTA